MWGVVRWPVGTFMKPHVDDNNVHNPDVFAAMLYLNDDFVGGHTLFEQYDIKPEVGKLIVFLIPNSFTTSARSRTVKDLSYPSGINA